MHQGSEGAQLGILRLSYFRRVFLYLTALVSAIVLASAVVSYVVARAQVLRAAKESSESELQRISASFSTVLASSVIPSAVQLYAASPVTKLIYARDPSDGQLLEATQLVDHFKLANPLIDSIVIYNHQNSTFYSTKWGRLSAEDPGLAEEMEILNDVRRFPLYRIISRRAEGTRLFTVVVGSPPLQANNLLGALIVNVSEPAVRAQILGGLDTGGTRFTLLDDRGEILSDTDPTLFGTQATGRTLTVALKSTESTGFFSDRLAAATVSFYRDPLNGWLFVSTTPDKALFREISLRRNQLLLIFGILFVLALVLALTTTRSAAVPVERLIAQARALQSDIIGILPAGQARNEIALVSETMRQLNNRLRSLRLAVAESTHYRRERALSRLLRGEILSLEERDSLAESLPIDEAAPARVAVLDLESSAADLAGLLEQVRGALPEVPGCVELERDEIALVLPATDQHSLHVARQALGLPCTIGVSDPVDELDALKEAYEAARHAARYRFRFGAGALIAASQCVAERPYAIPDEGLRRFSEHARVLDAAGASRVAQELLAEVRSYTYEDFVFLTQHLLYAVERLFGGLRGAEEGLSQLRTLRLSTHWADTPEGVSAVVERWCASYAAQARSQASDKTAGVVADIKRMVQENIGNADLGAKLIAEHLRMSVNYLRGIFKQAAGQSLSTYITQLRVGMCERLLREAPIKVKDAFTQVGFSNYTYAFTLFKKHTGRTPQEYQRANQSL